MTTRNYIITDGDDNQLGGGSFTSEQAMAIARRKAAEQCETVYLCPTDSDEVTPVEPLYAACDDVGPNRATVLAIGNDEAELRAQYEDRVDVAVLVLERPAEVGERIWI